MPSAMPWVWPTSICRLHPRSCGRSSTSNKGKGERSMIPAAFDYHVAQSVDEAIALMKQYGDDAKFLAGGHSLLPTMKLRLAQPAHLIDLGRISGLSYIREVGDTVTVGALTTYVTLQRSDIIAQNFALLPEGIAEIGDQQVRNCGTIGGSVAHSDPAADTPGMVLALKATIVTRGPDGARTISADNFFKDLFETDLKPGEVITEIRFAKPAPHKTQRPIIKNEDKTQTS